MTESYYQVVLVLYREVATVVIRVLGAAKPLDEGLPHAPRPIAAT
jgi:hypothetical protein